MPWRQAELTLVSSSNFATAFTADWHICAQTFGLRPGETNLCPCLVLRLALVLTLALRLVSIELLALQLAQLLTIILKPLPAGIPLVPVSLPLPVVLLFFGNLQHVRAPNQGCRGYILRWCQRGTSLLRPEGFVLRQDLETGGPRILLIPI